MFKNIELPRSVAEGLSWGPLFDTDRVIEGGGGSQRNQNWSEAMRAADVAKACKDEATRLDLISFFKVVRGSAFSWKTRDWSDYVATQTEGFFSAVGDGTYQMMKRYTRSGLTYDETITLPETNDAGSGAAAAVPFVIYDAGGNAMTVTTDYTLSATSGILTPVGSPVKVPTTWKGPYFVRCIFETDEIRFVAASLEVFRTQVIPIHTTRFEETAS